MTTFVVCAVLLTLLTLAPVLAPLWRGSRKTTVIALALLAASALALYQCVGTPAAIEPQAGAQAAPRTLDEAIAQLRDALKRHPDQAEGWLLLGRSLASEEKFSEARDAFAEAVKRQPDDPEVLVAAAQARMLAAADRRLDATAVQMLQHALTMQPAHQRARWFVGMAQRQAGQPAAAADTWRPLLDQVDAATRGSLLQQINLARKEAGLSELDSPTVADQKLTVAVSLDPTFAAHMRLHDDASVFVIARVPGGAPMPVAVEKHAVRDLPLRVILDDSDSPMPTQKLSALSEVEVVARLSNSGNAMKQEGDVESAPVTLSLPASKPVQLVLGR